MGTFPISIVPDVPWRHRANSKGAYFGAWREDLKEYHGACDLLSPATTPVLAVADGTIMRGPYEFSNGTYAVDVVHADFIARYCEIERRLLGGLAEKSDVKEGQVFARVGVQPNGTMLHFEMFRDVKRNTYDSPLTDYSGSKYLYVTQALYNRRNDLLDPTPYLDDWWQSYKDDHHRNMDTSMD